MKIPAILFPNVSMTNFSGEVFEMVSALITLISFHFILFKKKIVLCLVLSTYSYSPRDSTGGLGVKMVEYVLGGSPTNKESPLSNMESRLRGLKFDENDKVSEKPHLCNFRKHEHIFWLIIF